MGGPGRPWGVLGRIGGVPGVSLSPPVARATSLRGPRGALGGSSEAMTLIDRHPPVTSEAVFLAPNSTLHIPEKITVYW